MATWQFDLILIPKQKLVEMFGHVPDKLEREVFESIDWWETSLRFSDCREVINTFLTEIPAWSDAIKIFGCEDGNRIDLCVLEEWVEEVFIRIDVWELDIAFLEGIARFAKHCGAMLLTTDSTIIEPRTGALLLAAQKSNAARFVSDPAAFLRSVNRDEIMKQYEGLKFDESEN